jgi:RimJ/RimL family protein N-acetyltransferase
MLLRSAMIADLAELVEVQRSGSVHALNHIFPQEEYPFPEAQILARWAAEIGDPAVDVYVIEQPAGVIAGFVALRGSELLHFGTAIHMWGTGFASVAHQRVVQLWAATGVASAWLRVFEENRRARRFYEKMGWRCTRRLSRTSFPPYPVLVEYELTLPQHV